MDLLVSTALLDRWDQGVKKVTLVILDQPEAREYRGHLDLLVPRDLQEQKAMRDLKVLQDFRAQRDRRDQEDTQDLPVH